MHDLNYWEQLKSLKMYSLQRRRERYIILYVWKALEGKVPKLDAITADLRNDRLGRKCLERPLNRRLSSKLRTLRDNSFASLGPKLFNKLPRRLRVKKMGDSVDNFKARLDHYLTSVPDEPQLRNYTTGRQAETNSLLDMSCLARTRPGLTEEHADCDASGGRPQTAPRD